MSRLAKYRKLVVAVATGVVEIVAVWQDAPPWALTAAAVAGAFLVWRVPNTGLPLPHMSSTELLELAERQAEREQA